MERLKSIKECLIAQVQAQMGDLACVDTHELGEVIDMIKDLEQAMYYCSVVEAMEEGGETKFDPHDEHYMYNHYNDYNRNHISYYTEREYDVPHTNSKHEYEHDSREGKSPMKRKKYMEAKENHQDKTIQMQELEDYLKELSMDITELVDSATAEEKTLLKQKISALATKIV